MDRNEILMTLDLAEGQTRLEGVQLMPIGAWKHPRGIIQITAARARKFAESFKQKIAGQDLPILYIHSARENISNPKYGEAAGWVTDVNADDERGVLVDIEFTKEGAAAVRDKKYRYLSAEYFNKVQLPHHDRPHEDVIVGAALVNKPHLKGMDPILNSETGHLLVSEVGETDKQGGGPMDPILAQLAKLAGIELSEDAEELTDDQSAKIKDWVEAQKKDKADADTKISLLETRLEDLEPEGEKKARSLKEAGFEEEATLLNEYRADKAVRRLSEDVPSGQELTPVAETHMRAYVLEEDQEALGELLKLAFEGKATVDLVEHGTILDPDADTDTESGTELVDLATKRAKEDEISFSDAMDLVAAENPEKWNEYQLSMDSHQAVVEVGGSE